MRALIIDDEDSSRILLTAILEPYGFETVESENCADAWQILESQPRFDLALVDWNTPKMSGIDFLKKVRADTRFQDLLVIMITGMNDMPNVKEALQQGANEYVMKPFTEDMILDKMKIVGIDLPEING